MNNTPATSGTIALIALCHEYCTLLENTDIEAQDFVKNMLGYLPRIYISTFDIKSDSESNTELYNILGEDQYDAIRDNISALLGEHDTYLDTFSEDMKYSDTPIAASISENLCDLYQIFYNFIATVRDMPTEYLNEAVITLKEDFDNYWSGILCAAMRALNNIYPQIQSDEI